MAAVALVPLNSTMIAVALPDLLEDLSAKVSAGTFIVTGYLVVMAFLQPFTGRLGDRFGRRRLLLGGLIWFALASAGAVLAPGFGWLLAFRLQQAAAGALMAPNSFALLRSVIPLERRASRFGMVGATTSLAAGLGPVVGGLLVSVGGWRAIFAANVPVVALALLLGARAPEGAPEVRPDDADGEGVLRNRRFLAAASAMALQNLNLYTLLLAIPLLLTNVRGWEEAGIGLLLSSLTLGGAVLSPLGGRLADRIGRRRPAVMGLSLVTAAAIPLVVLGGEVSPIALVTCLLLSGVGMGIAGAGMQTAALESVRADQAGVASGLFSTSRYVGSITGSLALAGLISADDTGGYRVLFGIMAVAAALATVSASRMQEWPADDPQYERAT
jgi:MFS family permease